MDEFSIKNIVLYVNNISSMYHSYPLMLNGDFKHAFTPKIGGKLSNLTYTYIFQDGEKNNTTWNVSRIQAMSASMRPMLKERKLS